VDPKVDLGGDSAAAWGFSLASLIIRQVAVPIANAMALDRRTPNVEVRLYYSLYGDDGIRVPGLTVDNQSTEPIWVDGVIINNAGGVLPRPKVVSPKCRILPPVVEPGTSGNFYIRPADTEGVFRRFIEASSVAAVEYRNVTSSFIREQ
jgi:hypothetical protein